ncbi:hypothetical protein B0H16DRAFT_1899705, partial [Mycena metata]
MPDHAVATNLTFFRQNGDTHALYKIRRKHFVSADIERGQWRHSHPMGNMPQRTLRQRMLTTGNGGTHKLYEIPRTGCFTLRQRTSSVGNGDTHKLYEIRRKRHFVSGRRARATAALTRCRKYTTRNTLLADIERGQLHSQAVRKP